MKREILKRFLMGIAGMVFSVCVSATAMAGQWMANEIGYWYLHSDGSYPVYSWQWIDSDGDGIYQCYAFDENGYLYLNTVTPDGYYVGPDGAWYVDSMPVSRVFFHNAYIAPVAISVPQDVKQNRDQFQYASDGTQLVTQIYSSPKSSSNTSSSKNSSSTSKSSSSGSKSSTRTSTNVKSSDLVTSKIVTGSSSGTSADSDSAGSSKSSSASGPDMDNTSYDTAGPGRNIPSNYSSQTVKPTTDESTLDVSGPRSGGVIERDGIEDEEEDED
ncbi:hypothetical protein UYO_3181 [Lachnospiraceae bacterium JC7]|nr:hypothetical protein UYO_3181 [Lachnospiraceae bacterium JC7]